MIPINREYDYSTKSDTTNNVSNPVIMLPRLVSAQLCEDELTLAAAADFHAAAVRNT